MKLSHSVILIASLLTYMACNDEALPLELNQNIIGQLSHDYNQLPEGQISVSSDFRLYAQYASPTEKYRHGIMGDGIEAEQLVVVLDSVFYELTLEDNFVYEDIRPRLYDVDDDGDLEIITIRSDLSQGAGIAIYKIIGNRIIQYAYVEEIGHINNWLNLVAIDDLDNDGIVELVWIQTPHIGGILKSAKIDTGKLEVIDMVSGYSNHSIGERNLCLSVLADQNGEKIFYVPTQERDRIVGFTLTNNKFEIHEEIIQNVDFAMPLKVQYNFGTTVEKEDNCIDAG